jgi:hypothetical protein
MTMNDDYAVAEKWQQIAIEIDAVPLADCALNGTLMLNNGIAAVASA